MQENQAYPQPPSFVPGSQQPQPPSSSPPTPTYAGFWIRTAAGFLDLIVPGIPFYGASSLIAYLLGQPSPLLEGYKSILFWIMYLIYLVVYIFFVTKFGATPGKMYYGLKVITSDGTYPKIGRALLREVLGKFLSTIILYLGFLWAAFDKDKQGWHDKIAGTHVILTKPISGFRKFTIYLFGFFIILLPILIILLPILLILTGVSLFWANRSVALDEAKDVYRKTNIDSTSTALRLYYTTYNRYPSDLDELLTSNFLAEIPKDPTGSPFTYTILPDGSAATLYDFLEKGDTIWCWKSSTDQSTEVSSPADCQP